jgi:7-cyano-7-deazaguanine synthase
MMVPAGQPDAGLAVLVSGGLDSAILLGTKLREGRTVHPLYVRHGLAWERDELEHLRRFLQAVDGPGLRPFQVLDMPVKDLYGDHWSITGLDVPDGYSPDVAVFLPGRNVLLLAKAMLWCHLRDVHAVALASLGSNPFPDATPAFFDTFQDIVNRAVGGAVRVEYPFAGLHKVEVMRHGRELPLELTFSCIQPVAGKHCGTCNKCAERQRAFAEAEMTDPTEYTRR